MKTTGVVRRIDDLGRIVVPKEIRRTLRIRDGESLEIFIDKDVIGLKKYSPMSDLEDISSELVEVVHQFLKSYLIITDRDEVLAVSGSLKKIFQGKAISKELEEIIISKKEIESDDTKTSLEIVSGETIEGSIKGITMVVNGDPIGEVLLYRPEGRITDTERHVLEIIAQFLEKHIEE